jgi:hypothetical protein
MITNYMLTCTNTNPSSKSPNVIFDLPTSSGNHLCKDSGNGIDFKSDGFDEEDEDNAVAAAAGDGDGDGGFIVDVGGTDAGSGCALKAANFKSKLMESLSSFCKSSSSIKG